MKTNLLLFFLAGFGIPSLGWAADLSPMQPKDGTEFIFEQGGLTVPVHYYVPDESAPNAPVVIVMPGMDRIALPAVTDWVPHARDHHFILVVPEFSEREFPGVKGYQDGNMMTQSGLPIPRNQWTYSMIEPIFDEVCKRSHNHSRQYLIYGHSAGAQFVERLICFVPHARILRAVTANAGTYMMPDLNWAFPYGFGGTELGESELRAALGQPLVVLLGTADTDPHHKALGHAPGAEAQGTYRLARGEYFFAYGKKTATELKTPFGWTISYAPGVAHSDKGMAPFAIKCLFPDK